MGRRITRRGPRLSCILRSTGDILKSGWKTDFSQETFHNLPAPPVWEKVEEMQIFDVLLWEQLYYKIGSFGIYVSWNPYAEFYMIVHNMFAQAGHGIETFYGPTAHQDLQVRAADLGVELKSTKVWVDLPPPH